MTIKIYVNFRQTCFPDPEMEELIYSSANISFECFSRDCTRLREQGAGKLDLEPVIKTMLQEGIKQKSGEITCALADITCKNKLYFAIVLKQEE